MGLFITFAQNNEDVILDAFFSDVEKGFYVDVGANHPVNNSVTKHFYNKGWRGIDIEPIQSLYDLLREDRPSDIVIMSGVSDKEGELKLRQYSNTGLSTFSDDLKKAHSKTSQTETDRYQDIAVPVTTLQKLFEKHNVKHIHFMKIDVEGMELGVIKGNDWSKYRPEMICIESNHVSGDKDWRPILNEQRYHLVYNDGLNDYYLAQESMHRKALFSYTDTMLLGDQIMPFHVRNRIVELESELRDKDVKLDLQKIHALQLSKDKEALEHQIKEQQRLKSTVKLFAKALDKFILAYIEKLRRVKTLEASIDISNRPSNQYDASTREALLRSIQYADLATYYTTKTPRVSQKFYAHKAVKGTYTFARRVAALPYRLVAGRKKENK